MTMMSTATLGFATLQDSHGSIYKDSKLNTASTNGISVTCGGRATWPGGQKQHHYLIREQREYIVLFLCQITCQKK